MGRSVAPDFIQRQVSETLERALSSWLLGLDKSNNGKAANCSCCPKDKDGVDGGFKHIAKPMCEFVDWMLAAACCVQFIHKDRAKRAVLPPFEKFRFLDVGCGIGTKLLAVDELMRATHWESYGIEFREEYVDFANFLAQPYIGADLPRVCKADARTWEGYGAYDVIYYYRPQSNTEGQRKLQEQVFKFAKENTIFIADGSDSVEGRHIGCLGYRPPIYIKTDNELLVGQLSHVLAEFAQGGRGK